MSHLAGENLESVFYNRLPEYRPEYDFKAVEEQYEALFACRDDVMKALELSRAAGVIGKSLEACVTIYGDERNEAFKRFRAFEASLPEILIVSKTVLSDGPAPAGAFTETASGVAVEVRPAARRKVRPLLGCGRSLRPRRGRAGPLRTMQKRYLPPVLIIAGILVADQLTKWLVRATMAVGETRPFLPHLMQFTHVQNRGASFGILAGHRWVYMLLSAAALVVMGVLLFKYVSRHPLLTTALAFLIGGGAGNMIDRLFVTDAMGNKVVTDFFEFTFVDFAVFNVADIFITFGAVLLGVYIVFFEGKVEKRLKEQAEESQNDDGDGA